MTPAELKAEVTELMEDRGYNLDKAIERVANNTGMTPEEVREAYEGTQD